MILMSYFNDSIRTQEEVDKLMSELYCFTACFTSLFTDLFALRAYATIARYIGNHERRNRKHNRQRRQQ